MTVLALLLVAWWYPELWQLHVEGIETETPCGKRDYAMVVLAVSTGLRCCDIVALRLDGIDWRRDEIRLVQAKTSKPLVLPLPPLAGNAVAEWILHGRPDCDAPEVRRAPYSRSLWPNSTGSTLMRRRLARAGIDHAAHDGKSFHALRRSAGTRLIESGAGLPLAAQILGVKDRRVRGKLEEYRDRRRIEAREKALIVQRAAQEIMGR